MNFAPYSARADNTSLEWMPRYFTVQRIQAFPVAGQLRRQHGRPDLLVEQWAVKAG
jgi:hypothetical protein